MSFNDGHGEFTRSLELPTGNLNLLNAALGDIDGDGDVDALATISAETVVLRNILGGRLQPPVISVVPEPSGITWTLIGLLLCRDAAAKTRCRIRR